MSEGGDGQGGAFPVPKASDEETTKNEAAACVAGTETTKATKNGEDQTNAVRAAHIASLPAQRQPEELKPSSLATLPPEVLRRVLCTLPLSERAKLRQTGYKSLAKSVSDFDTQLMRSVFDSESSRIVPPDHEDSEDKAVYDALRRDVVATVEHRRWLDTPSSSSTQTQETGQASHKKCHLRRLTKGDFLGPVQDGNNWNYDGFTRTNGYYDDAKLIDGHIWVLYSDYWFCFDVIDIDSGKGKRYFYPCSNGPQNDYVNDEEGRMSLRLDTFDGRHGMLAAGMSGVGAAHGPWSGPYVSVWDISTQNTLMAIDLYKPQWEIIQVNIVSRDKLVVLLRGPNNDVELQWHKIPRTAIDPKVESPPPDPPAFNVSTKKTKRPQLKAYSYTGIENEEETTSYDYRRKYRWWPCQETFIQSDRLGRGDKNSAMMACDGRGFLAVIVDNVLSIFVVGTMDLIRCCWPFGDQDFLEKKIGNLSMHTALYPIEDVLGPGEGEYYASDRSRSIPKLNKLGKVQCSTNPIDLANCYTQTLLARFAHLTYDEQRNFEAGYCGRNGAGNRIIRSTQMKDGACSPQLDCYVRVAFTVSDPELDLHHIFQADLRPFHQLRHRASLRAFEDDREWSNEHLDMYENACLGKSYSSGKEIGLWSSTLTSIDEYGDEQLHVLDWKRGGAFDFYDGGPSDEERSETFETYTEEVHSRGGFVHRDPVAREHIRAFSDVFRCIHRSRTVSHLHIDAYKLVVCTFSEVTVLPFSLDNTTGERGDEAWRQDIIQPTDDEEREYTLYRFDNSTKTLHSFRPTDDILVSRWNDIRMLAEYRATNDFRSRLEDPDRQNSTQTIVSDLRKSIRQEKELMEATNYKVPGIFFPQFSWRYVTLVSGALTDAEPAHELLHVFDTLAEWAGEKRSNGEHENGLNFHGCMPEDVKM